MTKHAIHRVVNFRLVGAYSIEVEFDDLTKQLINFEPILRGEVFGPLRDVTMFRQVKIDHEVHTLVWPNGADFDPATLHDWPDYVAELTQRAKKWEILPV